MKKTINVKFNLNFLLHFETEGCWLYKVLLLLGGPILRN